MSAVRCPLAKVGCQAAEPAKALFAQWEKSIYKMAKMMFCTCFLLAVENQEITTVSDVVFESHEPNFLLWFCSTNYYKNKLSLKPILSAH